MVLSTTFADDHDHSWWTVGRVIWASTYISEMIS